MQPIKPKEKNKLYVDNLVFKVGILGGIMLIIAGMVLSAVGKPVFVKKEPINNNFAATEQE